MKKRSLINWGCLSGILCLLFYILHITIGVLYYPDYNWMSQAVSDLTAIDAPSFIVANGLSQGYGIFACICCVLISILIENKGNKFLRVGIYLFTLMNLISAIGYSLFPLSTSGYAGTFQDIMHVYVVTSFVVILSIISLILITIGGFRTKHRPYQILSILSVCALSSMFIGALSTAIVPVEYFGIAERFSVYSAVIFTAILGFYGFNNFYEKTS